MSRCDISGRAQMAAGLAILIGIDRQFASQPVRLAGDRSRQVLTGEQAAEPDQGVHTLAMCGHGTYGIPTVTDQTERPAHDRLPPCGGNRRCSVIGRGRKYTKRSAYRKYEIPCHSFLENV